MGKGPKEIWDKIFSIRGSMNNFLNPCLAAQLVPSLIQLYSYANIFASFHRQSNCFPRVVGWWKSLLKTTFYIRYTWLWFRHQSSFFWPCRLMLYSWIAGRICCLGCRWTRVPYLKSLIVALFKCQTSCTRSVHEQNSKPDRECGCFWFLSWSGTTILLLPVLCHFETPTLLVRQPP